MIGIYKITNLINNNSYIGQSVDIIKRWRSHFEKALVSTTNVYNYPLSRAIRKYGKDNFSCEVLEECLIPELDTKEKHWIAYFDTFRNGYNQGLGGNRGSVAKDKTKILGIITDLETTDLYHHEIAKKWSISTEMVQGINTGRYWRQDREYPIQRNTKIKAHRPIFKE